MVFRALLALLLVIAPAVAGDHPFKQLHAGYNGPESPVTAYYRDGAAFRRSWASEALEPKEVERIIKSVDFSSQVLLVSAVGERKAVTKIELNAVHRYDESLSPFILVGVANTSCPGARLTSFPFVIAVVDLPASFDEMANYFHQNFPDECKPSQSGKPAKELPNNSSKPTPLRGAA